MASKPYFRKVVKVKPVYIGQIGTIVSLLFNKNYLIYRSPFWCMAVGQLYGFISACTARCFLVRFMATRSLSQS